MTRVRKSLTWEDRLRVLRLLESDKEGYSRLTVDEATERIIKETGLDVAKSTVASTGKSAGVDFVIRRNATGRRNNEAVRDKVCELAKAILEISAVFDFKPENEEKLRSIVRRDKWTG